MKNLFLIKARRIVKSGESSKTSTRAMINFQQLLNGRALNMIESVCLIDKFIPDQSSQVDEIGQNFDYLFIIDNPKSVISDAIRAYSKVAIFEIQALNLLEMDNLQATERNFIVYELIPGTLNDAQIVLKFSAEVSVYARYKIEDDCNREIYWINAKSKEAISAGCSESAGRIPIAIREIGDLSSKFEHCLNNTFDPTTKSHASAFATEAVPAQIVNHDPRTAGSYYVKHIQTQKYLSLENGAPQVTASPSTQWKFIPNGDQSAEVRYSIQESNGAGYLFADISNKTVTLGLSTSPWWSFLIGSTYRPQFESYGSYLNADSSGKVFLDPNFKSGNLSWEVWNKIPAISPLEQQLNDLVHGTKYNFDWPEDSYTGDTLSTYKLILSLLPEGAVPKKGNVTASDMNNVLNNKPTPAPPEWDTVFTHLNNEVSAFTVLNNWYGDGGHLSILLNEITINNLDLINKVQNMAKPPPTLGFNFFIGIVFSLFQIGFAAVPPAGPVISAIIGGIWRGFNSATGGSHETLSATIATLEAQLSTTFNLLITQRENDHTTISQNYGKLKTFNAWVTKGTLVWPDNTSTYRAIAAREFEISVWQRVTASQWIISYVDNLSPTPITNPAGQGYGKFVVQFPVTYSDGTTLTAIDRESCIWLIQ